MSEGIPWIQPWGGFKAIGLYRDGKITLRQAADLIGVSIEKMPQILQKHNTYVSYGVEELKEDIAYATSSQRPPE